MRAAISFILEPPHLDFLLAPAFMHLFLLFPSETVFAGFCVLYALRRKYPEHKKIACYFSVLVWASMHLLPTAINIGYYIYIRDVVCIGAYIWNAVNPYTTHHDLFALAFFFPLGSRADSSWTMCLRVMCTLLLNYNIPEDTPWIEWAYPLVCGQFTLLIAVIHTTIHMKVFKPKEAIQ